jgi:vacuolar-type H+-ATPase subunit D/Vma8
MDEAPGLSKAELEAKSQKLSSDMNRAYKERTEQVRGALKMAIQDLSLKIDQARRELDKYVDNLDTQLAVCNVMTNAKPVQKVCQQRVGSDEYNFCCCRSNGLAIFDPRRAVAPCPLLSG